MSTSCPEATAAPPRCRGLRSPSARAQARRKARDRSNARGRARQIPRRERRAPQDALSVGGWPASSDRLNKDAPEHRRSCQAHRDLAQLRREQPDPEELRDQADELLGSLWQIPGHEHPAAFARADELYADAAMVEQRDDAAMTECASADRQLIEAEAHLTALCPTGTTSKAHELERAAAAARLAVVLAAVAVSTTLLDLQRRVLLDSVETNAPPALQRGTRTFA